ncbi:hypothetical protein Anas_07698 [Armadillidium nasatum]|uniref:Uncharacterized protein n=1 Tax=Armadillidium nasatum TaxID=96803 RepID=A0A5N5TKR8_9CRUS|nr:hypothetical protein Anas_07698 [Armadillidium nasatum]
MFSLSLDCWGRLLAAAQIPVLGSHSSAWITLQCSDSIPVLGSLSSAWLVSSARIRIHSVSVSSTRISFSAYLSESSNSCQTSLNIILKYNKS